MRAKATAAILVLLPLLVLGLVACGTDSGAAANQIDPATDEVQSVAIVDETHDDGDAHDVAITDEHDEIALDMSNDEEAESHAHARMDGPVDPDAPVMNVFASEFGYETTTTEVAAGLPFSIQINNAGVLEHDITFAGFEHQFGLHVQPGENDIATFSIDEAGEYVYYCTIPGHREAGMTGTLMVSNSLVVADEEVDHVDEHDVLITQEPDDHGHGEEAQHGDDDHAEAVAGA